MHISDLYSKKSINLSMLNPSQISVIIPCYNQAKYLPETLDCLIAQSYQNWEAIVIDDGSVDNTSEVVSVYTTKDNRIKYVHQENQGVSVARNNAIKLYSSGEYILPLDADDLIASTYLEKAIEYLEKHPETKVVYCQAEKFGAEKGRWNLPEYDFNKMLFENLLFCTAMFRRIDYYKCGGYNENMKEGVEDWDFWLSMLGPEDVVHRIDEVLFYYRIKEFSRNMVAKDDLRMAQLRRTIYNNHKEYYADYVQDIISYVRKCNSAESRIEKLNNSLSMRIGRTLTLPFGKIRDFLKFLF